MLLEKKFTIDESIINLEAYRSGIGGVYYIALKDSSTGQTTTLSEKGMAGTDARRYYDAIKTKEDFLALKQSAGSSEQISQ